MKKYTQNCASRRDLRKRNKSAMGVKLPLAICKSSP